jgi:hypothetical protein
MHTIIFGQHEQAACSGCGLQYLLAGSDEHMARHKNDRPPRLPVHPARPSKVDLWLCCLRSSKEMGGYAMASNIPHAVFGEVEFDERQDQNVWETEIEWSSRTVRVDITFDGAAMSPGVLDGLAPFVTNVASLDQLARQSMRQDFGSLIADYLDFDSASNLLQEVFGTQDKSSLDAEMFVSPMHLVRIGLYPDDPDAQAVFDYTLGTELTDQLAVVNFGDRRTVTSIAVAS